MSESYEDTGYTPAGNKTYVSRKRRNEIVRDRELAKIFAELDSSLQKSVDPQSEVVILEGNQTKELDQ